MKVSHKAMDVYCLLTVQKSMCSLAEERFCFLNTIHSIVIVFKRHFYIFFKKKNVKVMLMPAYFKNATCGFQPKNKPKKKETKSSSKADTQANIHLQLVYIM
ncbi:hypothetical protein MAR_036699 [Mya arenaria]|uniref:Uncharacterized protein n=1 Tax=Mya arenaria TaxID=6604 RepID=A0ABY7FLF7_MYAAR|nr:hypothetical protein MAR_036699 [Mya arenaria]